VKTARLEDSVKLVTAKDTTPVAEPEKPAEPVRSGDKYVGNAQVINYSDDAILPKKRIIAFYGNPLSKRMGIMGELPVDEMLAKLDKEVAAWEKADTSMKVQPALHLIAVTAQGQPGRGNKYRLRMTDKVIEQVIEMASR